MDMENIKAKLQEVLPDGEVLDKELLEQVVGGLSIGAFTEKEVFAQARSGGIRGLSSLAGKNKLFDAKETKNQGTIITTNRPKK